MSLTTRRSELNRAPGVSKSQAVHYNVHKWYFDNGVPVPDETHSTITPKGPKADKLVILHMNDVYEIGSGKASSGLDAGSRPACCDALPAPDSVIPLSAAADRARRRRRALPDDAPQAHGRQPARALLRRRPQPVHPVPGAINLPPAAV